MTKIIWNELRYNIDSKMAISIYVSDLMYNWPQLESGYLSVSKDSILIKINPIWIATQYDILKYLEKNKKDVSYSYNGKEILITINEDYFKKKVKLPNHENLILIKVSKPYFESKDKVPTFHAAYCGESLPDKFNPKSECQRIFPGHFIDGRFYIKSSGFYVNNLIFNFTSVGMMENVEAWAELEL